MHIRINKEKSTLRTLHKILAGLALAGALTLGVVWGSNPAPIQKAVSTVAENIQKPRHLAFADVDVYIQKPGH